MSNGETEKNASVCGAQKPEESLVILGRWTEVRMSKVSWGCFFFFKTHKSINAEQHINRLEDKNLTIISKKVQKTKQNKKNLKTKFNIP
jgi:hypothetical protein